MLLKLKVSEYEEAAVVTGSYAQAVAEYSMWLGCTRLDVMVVMRLAGAGAGERQHARAEAIAEVLGRVLREKIRSVLRDAVEQGLEVVVLEVLELLEELQQEVGIAASVRDGKVVLEVHEFGSARTLVQLLKWLDEHTVRA